MLNDFQTIIDAEKKLGLKVNAAKCELHFIDSEPDHLILQKYYTNLERPKKRLRSLIILTFDTQR